MEAPTREQVMEAISLIDQHLETCTDENCAGLNDELAAIHPDLAGMVLPEGEESSG